MINLEYTRLRLRLRITDSDHITFMHKALEEAQKCTPTPTAFCVGCVIVLRQPNSPALLSTGYSRELLGNTHAEANALAKARALKPHQLQTLLATSEAISIEDALASSDVYTTLEPCSVRTSGLSPCADALIAAKVKRCFIGVGEPDDFVICEGAQKLKDAGIQVIWLKGLETECLQEARRGHGTA
jgi:pyrimidine deaminase RibD-like protein